MSRKFRREQQKAQYQKFVQAWRDEKRFQQYLVDVQGSEITQKGDQMVIISPNGESVPVLGRRPTFQMWLAAARDQKQAQEKQRQERDRVAVDDLSWEEETVRPNSLSASTGDVSSS